MSCITKPVRTSIGIGLFFALLFFLAGPRVQITGGPPDVDLPPDIEAYIEKTEARFEDLIPGTEKTIIWAGEKGVKTPLSIIYLHGFSSSRQETAPLSDYVAKELNANLFYTRFTGHGRGGHAMLDGSIKAWLKDSVEALKIGQRLGEKVVVMGVSTGGTAATWLAAQPFSKKVAAFVLISPNFGPADPKATLLLWPWGENIAEFIVGPEYSWEAQNKLHEKFWTHRYPTRALLPMMGLVNLTLSQDLSDISQPVLMIYSPEDTIVNPSKMTKTFEKFSSKNKQSIVYLKAKDPSQHILAGDILSPGSTKELADIIVKFVLK